jgi:uncharacterized protein YjbJ (UPF0337 family)
MGSGTTDKVKGKAKSALGGATNNRGLQAKGEAQKLVGAAKDKLDGAKRKLDTKTRKKKSS